MIPGEESKAGEENQGVDPEYVRREAERVSKIAEDDVTAAEERMDAAFEKTPYEALPEKLRQKADPIIARLVKEAGADGEQQRTLLRHAYLARDRGGRNSIPELLEHWNERLARYEGAVDARRLADAERQLKELEREDAESSAIIAEAERLGQATLRRLRDRGVQAATAAGDAPAPREKAAGGGGARARTGAEPGAEPAARGDQPAADRVGATEPGYEARVAALETYHKALKEWEAGRPATEADVPLEAVRGILRRLGENPSKVATASQALAAVKAKPKGRELLAKAVEAVGTVRGEKPVRPAPVDPITVKKAGRWLALWDEAVAEKDLADQTKARAALTKLGAEQVGKVGDVVRYDAGVHEAAEGGGSLHRGEVVRAGWKLADGTVLRKPLVRRHAEQYERQDFERQKADAEAAGRASQEAAEADRGPAEGGPDLGPVEVAPGVYFSHGTVPPQGGHLSRPRPAAKGEEVGPFEINATIDRLLDVKNYTEGRVPYDPTARAAALTREQAIVTGKAAAGDPATRIEEHAHVLAARLGFETSPQALGPQVARGFVQFDGGRHGMTRTGVVEGFGQWLVRRSAGRLDGLTPEQQAADRYAEQWVQKQRGLAGSLDRVRGMFTDYLKQNPTQQAAGLVSATGRPAEPVRTTGEATSDAVTKLGEDFQDAVDTNLGALLRLQKDAARKGLKVDTGADAVTTYSRLMFADKSTAGEFERDGVFTIRDGHKVRVGQSLDRVLAPLHPDDLAPFRGDLSKFDVYAVARHVLDEAARGRDVVPEEQRAQYEAAMGEFKLDPAFVARAAEAAKNLTAAFNATLDALASPGVHYLSPKVAEGLKAARPTYVPTERVVQDAGWQARTGGKQGEHQAQLIRERSGGSGEQIVSPLVSYKKRLAVTAAIMNEQLRRNAVVQYLLAPGMGEWALPGEAKLTEAGAVKADVLKDLGVADAEIPAILRGLGVDVGESYFTTKPWPTDGTKPTFWWRDPQGKPTNFRIGDRALYDLLTGQQTEANEYAKIVKAIAQFPVKLPLVGRVEPLQLVNKLVRTGATTLNLGFQVRNVPRDVYEFFKNTVDRASTGGLPDAYRRAYAFEMNALTGKVSKDVLFKLFADQRGTDLRQWAFDKTAPESAYGRLREGGQSAVGRAASSVWGFAKGLLNVAGAAELAPRFHEFKTRLMKTTGKTEKELTAALEAADGAAAEGKGFRSPIPEALVWDAMNHAAEVTVPFQRQGVLTRELNKITPFFGPAVAGLSKAIRNWKTNAKGAALGMTGLLGLRLVHWSMFHDEEWWQELKPNDRYNSFVVPTPFGLRRLPGPRDLEVPAGGFLVAMLDAASNKRPDFAGLVERSIEALVPPGVNRPLVSLSKGEYGGALQEAAVAPFGPAGGVGLDLTRNKSWTGSPIVPRREENLPAADKFLEHQGPYALQQVSGGRADVGLKGAGLIPFSEVRNARRSVDDVFEKVHEMEGERAAVRRQGMAYRGEAEYQRLHAAAQRLQFLGAQLRGERKAVGGRVVKGEEPGEDRKADIRAQMTALARPALQPR